MGAGRGGSEAGGTRAFSKDVRNRGQPPDELRQLEYQSGDGGGGVAQIEDIRYLEKEMGLEKLPKNLEIMARLRLENPEASLVSLGELLEPPIGKSGVNARLRRISEIARNLRSGEDTHLGTSTVKEKNDGQT